MQQSRNKLSLWLRYDSQGFIVPSASQLRPISDVKGPRDGIWRRAPLSICCSPSDGYILFRNTTASANIIAISDTGKAVNWSGTLANGGYLMFPIPNGYDQTWSVTVDTPSSRTITTSVTQQNTEATAAISAVGAITLATNTFTTNVSPGAQYLVILS